jgi:hypothetical protein
VDATSSLETAEPLQCLGGFEGEQELAQLVGHRGRHTLAVTVFVELPCYSVSEVRTRIWSKDAWVLQSDASIQKPPVRYPAGLFRSSGWMMYQIRTSWARGLISAVMTRFGQQRISMKS